MLLSFPVYQSTYPSVLSFTGAGWLASYSGASRDKYKDLVKKMTPAGSSSGD